MCRPLDGRSQTRILAEGDLLAFTQPNTHTHATMSTTWRSVFTYVQSTQRPTVVDARNDRYNKYAQITARAVRQSLKETERATAEKRGSTALRYQKWENGVGGQQVSLLPPSLCASLDKTMPNAAHLGIPEPRGGQVSQKGRRRLNRM